MKAQKFLGYFLVGIMSSALTLGAFFYFQKPYPAGKTERNKPNMTTETQSGQDSFPAVPVANRVQSDRAIAAPFDFREIVKKTEGAVVNVHNTQYVIPIYRFGFGYGEGRPYKQEGTGSGVIISPNGYIVTNYHVVKNANDLEVTLPDKRKFHADIVGIDPQNDLAVIKIPAKHLPYMTFGDSDKLEMGEWVIAIGYPYNLGTTVTAGIVSAKARDIKGDNKIQSFIQTDAAINPGNSGGALINEEGQLVGINTMIFSLTGSYIGYSFAIPSNIVRKVVNDILEYGTIQKGKIGIAGVELDGDTAKRLGIEQTEGIWISNVNPGSNSYKAGIRKGDIIVGLDDQPVKSMAELIGYLKTKQPGTTVAVHIIKPDGRRKTYRVTLEKNDTVYLPEWGLMLKNTDRRTLRHYGVKNGVMITQVRNRELLANGIAPGQLIVAVNNRPVYTVDDIQQAFDNRNQRLMVEIRTENGETVRYIFR